MTLRGLMEIEAQSPELAYVIREAAENGVTVAEAFEGLGASITEACGDFRRALDEAVSRELLLPAEREQIAREFWGEMKRYD